MGRPKLRSLEDVEKNLWELKFKRWRQMAVDRKELASVIMRPRLSGGRRTEEYVSNFCFIYHSVENFYDMSFHF